MAILQGLATIAELHDEGTELGAAMARAEIAESRLTRLLAARGDALYPLVRTLAHQLRAEGEAADWADVAELVLSEGKKPWGDNMRYSIASAFYNEEYNLRKKKKAPAEI